MPCSDASPDFGRFKCDATQKLAAPVQLRLPGREAVRLEHKRQDVRVAFAAEACRRIERHGRADTLEQVANRQAVEIGHEYGPDKGWSLPQTAQRCAVT